MVFIPGAGQAAGPCDYADRGAQAEGAVRVEKLCIKPRVPLSVSARSLQTRAWKGSWVCPWGQLVLVIEDLRQKGRTGGLCPFSTPGLRLVLRFAGVRAKCAAGEGCPFLLGSC